MAEQAVERLSSYTVAFLRPEGGHIDRNLLTLGGSGALRNFGGRKGILTAAHVLENLPKIGEIGIMRFLKSRDESQQLRLDMSLCPQVYAPGRVSQGELPDLCFLKGARQFRVDYGKQGTQFS